MLRDLRVAAGLALLAALGACDVRFADLSVRTALVLLGSMAEEPIRVDANLRSVRTEVTADQRPGTAEPELFSAEEGRNCE